MAGYRLGGTLPRRVEHQTRPALVKGMDVVAVVSVARSSNSRR
jgi:hypothetical protein